MNQSRDEKTCPICNGAMVKFSSLQKQKCVDCGTEYHWPLKEGQEPLIKYGR